MGNSLKKRPPVIIVLGLDNAGKTSILLSLQNKSIENVQPTNNSPLENLKIGHYKMLAWDLSGKDKVRNLWRHFYIGTDAVLFVIDSTDKNRILEAKQELIKLLNEPLLKDVVFTIFLNKSDQDLSLSQDAIEDILQIDTITPPPQNALDLHNKRIKIIQTCAIKSNEFNKNINESFISIIQQIKEKRKKFKL